MRTAHFILVCAALTVAPVAGAQSLRLPVQLSSSKVSERMDAFFDLCDQAERATPAADRIGGVRGPRVDLLARKARQQDNVAVALIQLLERENAYVAAMGSNLPPDYGDSYYAYLAPTVAWLNDRRSIKALIPAMRLGYDQMHAVAQFGDAAVPDLLTTLTTGPVATQAAMALGQMVRSPTTIPLTATNLDRIKDSLISVSANERAESSLREYAIKSLHPFSDDRIRLVMQKVVAEGSASPGQRYVRFEAKSWLAKHPKE